MRLINADAILPRLRILSIGERQIYGEASWGFAQKCIAVVEDAPTEEPKQKTGWWNYCMNGMGTCSECGKTQLSVYNDDGWQKFCGCCGAKMEGTDE